MNEPKWKFYRNGKIVPISEDEARHTFDRWNVLSDDREAALLLIERLWTEIDRLRARVAELEAELSDAVHALNAALSRGDRHGHRVAELESENAQHLAEIGRLHADILRMRGWEATPDGIKEVMPNSVPATEPDDTRPRPAQSRVGAVKT